MSWKVERLMWINSVSATQNKLQQFKKYIFNYNQTLHVINPQCMLENNFHSSAHTWTETLSSPIHPNHTSGKQRPYCYKWYSLQARVKCWGHTTSAFHHFMNRSKTSSVAKQAMPEAAELHREKHCSRFCRQPFPESIEVQALTGSTLRMTFYFPFAETWNEQYDLCLSKLHMEQDSLMGTI